MYIDPFGEPIRRENYQAEALAWARIRHTLRAQGAHAFQHVVYRWWRKRFFISTVYVGVGHAWETLVFPFKKGHLSMTEVETTRSSNWQLAHEWHMEMLRKYSRRGFHRVEDIREEGQRAGIRSDD